MESLPAHLEEIIRNKGYSYSISV